MKVYRQPLVVIANNSATLIPGLLFTSALAFASIMLARVPWLQANGVSPLTLSILLGMLLGNTCFDRISRRLNPGVAFTKARLLRLGIILYGFRITFQDIGAVGWAAVAIDAAVVTSTFGLACFLGTRVFGIERSTAILIGSGSSICGAAAVMATAPVVNGRPDQVTVAVATVVVFGTLSMFLYPPAYHLLVQLNLSQMTPNDFGIFVGSTIHEVAQVVATGRAVDDEAANTAVITKMVRVMMLAPFLVALSAWIARNPTDGAGVAPASKGAA